MCEVTGGSRAELCAVLLERNILIKDLTKKVGNGKEYVRIAVRSDDDNNRLIEEMKSLKL